MRGSNGVMSKITDHLGPQGVLYGSIHRAVSPESYLTDRSPERDRGGGAAEEGAAGLYFPCLIYDNWLKVLMFGFCINVPAPLYKKNHMRLRGI